MRALLTNIAEYRRGAVGSHAIAIGRRAVVAAGCVVLGVTALTPDLRAAGAEELTVEKGRVAVTCPLTIGGRFEATTSAVTGRVSVSPGSESVEGAFTVDLRGLETGIGLRNTHLRSTYLEVERGRGYDAAVLEKITLPGTDVSRVQGKVPFRGMLSLHGHAREVHGTAEIVRRSRSLVVKVQFPLRIDAFEFAKPTYLGVGVANDIRVEVHATLVSSTAATSSND